MQLDSRGVNLVTAWALAAAHALQTAVDDEAGGSGALAAAAVTIALFPDQRVSVLRPILALSPSGVVRTLDRLVEAGLAQRSQGADDGREVLIRPTRRGVRVAERVLAARAAAAGHLLEPLSERERAQFLELLEKL